MPPVPTAGQQIPVPVVATGHAPQPQPQPHPQPAPVNVYAAAARQVLQSNVAVQPGYQPMICSAEVFTRQRYTMMQQQMPAGHFIAPPAQATYAPQGAVMQTTMVRSIESMRTQYVQYQPMAMPPRLMRSVQLLPSQPMYATSQVVQQPAAVQPIVSRSNVAPTTQGFSLPVNTSSIATTTTATVSAIAATIPTTTPSGATASIPSVATSVSQPTGAAVPQVVRPKTGTKRPAQPDDDDDDQPTSAVRSAGYLPIIY